MSKNTAPAKSNYLGCSILAVMAVIFIGYVLFDYADIYETRQHKALRREGLTKEQIAKKSREQLSRANRLFRELTINEQRYVKLIFISANQLRQLTQDEAYWISRHLARREYSDQQYKELLRKIETVRPYLLSEWLKGNKW